MKKRQSPTLLDVWRANWNKACAQGARGDSRAQLRVRVYAYLVKRYREHPAASLPAQVGTYSDTFTDHVSNTCAQVEVFRHQATQRARASLQRLARIQESHESEFLA